jgi:hypothetical protein
MRAGVCVERRAHNVVELDVGEVDEVEKVCELEPVLVCVARGCSEGELTRWRSLQPVALSDMFDGLCRCCWLRCVGSGTVFARFGEIERGMVQVERSGRAWGSSICWCRTQCAIHLHLTFINTDMRHSTEQIRYGSHLTITSRNALLSSWPSNSCSAYCAAGDKFDKA